MIRITAHGAAAAPLLAALHERCFRPAWDRPAMAALLAVPGSFALTAEVATTEAAGNLSAAGLILCRAAADEGEILTLGVVPEARRTGVGRALLDASLANMRSLGAATVFLEVAADNYPAIALYEGFGFRIVGRRQGYYAAPGGTTDALVFCKNLQ